jgi:hemoglobin
MPQTFGGLPRLWLVGAFAIALCNTALAQDRPGPSLYQRMGGYDVIAAITDDFLGRMRADPRFSRFAGGRSLDSRTRARQLTVDLLCQLAGGPCTYIGRPMKAAHAGLAITDADWEGLMRHVAAALDQRKVPAKERDEFLALFSNLKKDLVEAGRSD